jgi:molybdopterin synthase sulfur carrier subunit
MIRLLYFARLREALGLAEESYAVDADGVKLASLMQALAQRGAPWDTVMQGTVRAAINQTIADPESLVRDGDEVAFFPPVTGG